MSEEKLPAMCTTSGEPVDVVRAKQTAKTGQHEAYIVLCPEERAKGFVRPYRDSYRHVKPRPVHPLRDLTADETTRYAAFGYAKYEAYPKNEGSLLGKFWTQAELDAPVCNAVTTMGIALSETYARNPQFYGSTFCCRCNAHFPVNEFVWTVDGQQVGS